MLRSYSKYALLFLFFSLIIILANWPWILYFDNGFPVHWDPPFHAWKLKLVADNLLAGHILPPGYNSNCFFPYSMTLYYEALHWPQAAVVALFLLFTHNMVLIYNWVHLLFWALSGCCFYFLLRELDFTETASFWGASVFTILPYRISYLVEFNMQQCVGLILLFAFIVRFLNNPSLWNALGMVLSFWFQSVSELYQAMIFLLSSPFLLLPLLKKYLPDKLKNKHFYINSILAAVVGAGLCGYFLRPYLLLHSIGHFERKLKEIDTHSLEPFSYLFSPSGKCLIPFVGTTHDELWVYPTIAVVIGVALYVLFSARALRSRQYSTPNWKEAIFDYGRKANAITFWLISLLFVAISLFPGYFPKEIYRHIIAFFLSTWLLLTFCLSFFSRPDDTLPKVFIRGLCCAAVFCFIISLGPELHFGKEGWFYENDIYLAFYDTIGLLSGMRVVSRFGIIVMIYLLIAAVAGLEMASLRIKHPGRWIWIPLFLIVFGGTHDIHHKFRKIEYPLHSKALKVLAQHPSAPLLVLPFGNRWNDSRYMLQIADTMHPLIYGWGGFYPDYHHEMETAYRKSVKDLIPVIGRIWPNPLLVLDKSAYVSLARQNREKDALDKYCSKLSEDSRFATYLMHYSIGPYAEYEKMTRSDFVDKYPVLTFSAFTGKESVRKMPVEITLNEFLLKKISIDATRQDYHVEIPKKYIDRIHPNYFKIRSSDKLAFYIENFNLEKSTSAHKMASVHHIETASHPGIYNATPIASPGHV